MGGTRTQAVAFFPTRRVERARQPRGDVSSVGLKQSIAFFLKETSASPQAVEQHLAISAAPAPRR